MISSYFLLIVFVFGTLVGSFLNCVICRLGLPTFFQKKLGGRAKRQSFLGGRSFCPNCHRILKWYDLIPILSFILLQGKCRYCQKKISWQYPLVEIATGGLFLLIFNEFSILNFQILVNFAYLVVVSCLLIIIFVYDLRHFIIPDKIIYPAIAIVCLYQIIFNTANFYSLILSALAASGFFFLIWLISQGRWMGLGDVKLGFLLGLFLGWPQVLTALFSAFLIGAIIGVGLIISGKKTLKSQVPLGPFLVLGAFIALLFGKDLINWYISFAT